MLALGASDSGPIPYKTHVLIVFFVSHWIRAVGKSVGRCFCSRAPNLILYRSNSVVVITKGFDSFNRSSILRWIIFIVYTQTNPVFFITIIVIKNICL